MVVSRLEAQEAMYKFYWEYMVVNIQVLGFVKFSLIQKKSILLQLSSYSEAEIITILVKIKFLKTYTISIKKIKVLVV